jgi:hypothetical protein
MTDKFDFAIERARQEKIAQDFARDIMIVGSTEEVGAWNPPEGFRNMHFIRCGVRTYEGHMPPMCAKIYAKHKSMGAGDAPKGMRPPNGFESDDGKGVYVFYFPEVWRDIQLLKAKLQKSKNNRDDFNSLVGNNSNVKIEVSDGVVQTRRK